MRAIWKGNISFALVTIPISLFSATRRNELSFHYLHKKDMSEVSYKRFCDTENVEVPWDEIVKGYEVEKDEFIVLDQKDFKDAAVEQTHTIDILDFVDEHTIDPRFHEKAYIVVPSKGADKAYALLRDAMAKTRSAGIGKIIVDLRKAGVGPKDITDLSGTFQVKVASTLSVARVDDDVPARAGLVVRPRRGQVRRGPLHARQLRGI